MRGKSPPRYSLALLSPWRAASPIGSTKQTLLGLIFILHATDRIEGFLFMFFDMSVGFC